MGYKVTGAAAVVEMDDGNPDIGTGRRVYLEHDATVPSDAKKAHVEHLLAVGIIDRAAATEGSTPRGGSYDGSSAPAKSGSKADWADWATRVANGNPEELAAIESMTRDQLAENYADKALPTG